MTSLQRIISPCFIFFLSHHAMAISEQHVARIYDIGKTQGQPSFIQTTLIERLDENSFNSSAKIEDKDGKVVMTEEVVIKDGKLVSQDVEQLQTNEAWTLEVKEGRAQFKSYKFDKNSVRNLVSSHSEDSVGAFINGPMAEKFLQQRWSELLKGDAIETKFSILELEKFVPFSFQKEKSAQRNGQDVLSIKMKPANFFISMFVDSLHMEFDLQTKRLLYFRGRTPLKKSEGGKLKPFDAEILYQ